MKIIKADNYSELCRTAAKIIIEKVTHADKINLGLATGSTPIGLYCFLVDDHLRNHTSYHHVKTFNLDEYVGLHPVDRNSYHYYMREHLFHHLDLLPENIYLPNGISLDLDAECEQYESLIVNQGGIELQLLGLGRNGHIGFNEPGTSFQSKTHVVALDNSTRKANSRFFDSIEQVPQHAITMGMETIFSSKEILLLVSGEGKAGALQRLLEGEILEEFPASILKKHPNITVIADNAAIGSNVHRDGSTFLVACDPESRQ
ncbi:glucosamine-6-phosphate deaminase [Neobacillus drentensis]|uniref:glucosamine-6-phosphate deaminase n=1 Tax=Neobacillus drentensis TaxID=220684 RepID=UPI00285802BF|nr:glucosamine-6-phosphate deaminase [Neobacillus drentensis]MDR7238864.1 glucosamine-6-phosphate deaminase [Neobacillus drentensis]